MVDMQSERLAYRPLTTDQLSDFHALVQDDHVRRYMMDGNLFPREWSEERIRESADLFERRGVGLWLTRVKPNGELAGFCGFLELPSLHPEPQLVYALRQPFTGRGLATEMALASIAEARRHPGFETIVAGVDEVNTASVRILQKLGFRTRTSVPGALGSTLVMALEGPAAA
jgi:[ribosomal protein S5]-alanine N-acetyltransferase